MEIAVVGNDEFTLGFRLAGIKNVQIYKNDETLNEIKNNPGVGIALIDQATFSGLNDMLKEDITNSIKPVWVVVSDKPQEELRKMIIRSIGVDLLQA